MSEPKFTAGPWYWHEPVNPNRADFGVVAGAPYLPASGAHRRIAWVGNASYPASTADFTEEVRANARLIAAAPEMLDALKLARQLLETQARLLGIIGNSHEETAPLLADMDAAIAKAEGREP